MSKVIKEISCIVGEYTNSQGEKKKRYQRIGSIIETKNGPMLKMDVIPLREGGWDGWGGDFSAGGVAVVVLWGNAASGHQRIAASVC